MADHPTSGGRSFHRPVRAPMLLALLVMLSSCGPTERSDSAKPPSSQSPGRPHPTTPTLSASAAAASPPGLGSVETEHLYLSGRGMDDAVPWEFKCSEGRRCGSWQKIAVPSNWELEGFGSYNYGHDDDPSDEAGHYRLRFQVPESWQGRRVDLVFEGSMTDTEASINGRSAGPRHQGGFYHFRYDVSDLLLPGAENALEVTVYKRSSNRSVNAAERDADYWVFGGIFRPVLLAAYPPESIRYVAIDARHDGRLALEIETDGAGPGDTVTAQVMTIGGEPVGPPLLATVGSDNHLEMVASISGISPWSAENPNLYQLELTLERDGEVRHRTRERFGFRTVEVRPGEGLFVNGKRTLLKGVNRHSFWPDSGRTTSRRISREDAELIKRMNVNAVRSSHYPPDKHFLEICDELGLYVIDELAGWHDAYRDDVGERLVREMVRRDVNHPSILIWANGNEGGWNSDLDHVFQEIDPQRRPVIHPHAIAGGFDTRHYLSYSELDRKLAGSSFGDRLRALFGPRPLVMPTELLHGLYDGGGGAGLADYWRLIRESPVAAGAFLWAFLDEAVVRTDRDGALDTDGNHAPDGIVGPYREPEASFDAIREIWSPIAITSDSPRFSGSLVVENRFAETDLEDCRFDWELIDYRADSSAPQAIILGQGSEPGRALAPGTSGTLDFAPALPPEWRQADVLAVTAFDHREQEVMTWTFPIRDKLDLNDGLEVSSSTKQDSGDTPPGAIRPAAGTGLESSQFVLTETADSILLESGRTRVEIDRATGELRAFSSAGVDLPIAYGPKASHGRSTLTSLRHQAIPGGYEVETRFEGALDSLRWRLTEAGVLELSWAVRPADSDAPVSVTFEIPRESLSGFTWLGRGPHPVWRNRTAGVRLGLWELPASEPMACGAYADVAWARLELDVGALLLEPSPGLFVSPCAPSYPADAGFTAALLPEGLALLPAIPAMGTKFHQAEDLGPMSRGSRSEGTLEGSVRLRFEPLEPEATPSLSN